MQVSVTEVRVYEAFIAPSKAEEKIVRLTKTEKNFLSFFYQSVGVFTALAIVLSVMQMGNAMEPVSLSWALVCNGSVGAAMGMLFALMHDVIINGRLEDK